MKEQDDLSEEKLTIDLAQANVISLLILIPIIILFGLPYYLIWGDGFDIISISNILLGGVSVFVFIILGVVFHELIHGIVWSFFAKKGFGSIKFGVIWKMLTPYCHCKEPLKIKHYIMGAIAPAIILGIAPSLYAILKGDLGLLMFGMFFTMAAAGDFLIINLIRKENSSTFVQDHPSEAGCYVYRNSKGINKPYPLK